MITADIESIRQFADNMFKKDLARENFFSQDLFNTCCEFDTGSSFWLLHFTKNFDICKTNFLSVFNRCILAITNYQYT